MSIQGNLQKLKKAYSKNKPVYLTCSNHKPINGKIAEIGNVFVYINTEEQDETVMVEIEKISDISLLRKS